MQETRQQMLDRYRTSLKDIRVKRNGHERARRMALALDLLDHERALERAIMSLEMGSVA